jgi:hypothetical protein
MATRCRIAQRLAVTVFFPNRQKTGRKIISGGIWNFTLYFVIIKEQEKIL